MRKEHKTKEIDTLYNILDRSIIMNKKAYKEFLQGIVAEHIK